LIVSDGGADDDKSYCSFGWVHGTDHISNENAKASVVTQCTLKKSMAASPYSCFFTHYLSYLEMQPPNKLYVTSYNCDNSSLLTNEETCHSRDIKSSNWYTKPDHDVIMTPSALRANLPLRLASLHVSSDQNGN
jgi:hypothetical protein